MSMACGSSGAGGAGSTTAPTAPPSCHDTSAGRISVAIWPGHVFAAATAAAASAPSRGVALPLRTQADTVRANASVSAVNGASNGRCHVA